GHEADDSEVHRGDVDCSEDKGDDEDYDGSMSQDEDPDQISDIKRQLKDASRQIQELQQKNNSSKPTPVARPKTGTHLRTEKHMRTRGSY
ncbi:hypothetical protein BGZ76_008249, partial [Entomortierella beljakovae]